MRSSHTLALLLVVCTVALGAARLTRPNTETNGAGDMAGAAGRLLDALSPDLRAKCQQDFDGPARTD